jgi:Family of unknown function (DUF6459)
MPSARNPDASLASSTVGSSAPSSAGAATPPLAAGKAVRRTDSPPAPAPAGAPAPALAFGGLRLVEVPGGWPPYDCEVHGTVCPAACEVSVASPRADLDPGASGGAGPPRPSLTFSAARPAEGTADPAVAWSRQFAQVVAEILAGARSPRQIAPWTTERVRDRIILLTQTLSTGQKPRIRRIVTSRPAARVVEMTVVLSFGPRSRALALRIEQLPGRRPTPGLPARAARWLCTEIEIG